MRHTHEVYILTVITNKLIPKLMKKILLLALVAISSLAASAQEVTIITEQPKGTVKVYDRDGSALYYYKGADGKGKLGKAKQDTLGTMTIVYAPDNKTIYIKDPLSIEDIGTWVKGTIEGNKITVPCGQYIYQSNEGWGVQVGMMKINSEGSSFEINNDMPNFTYTVAGNTISLDNTKEDLTSVLSGWYSDNKEWIVSTDIMSKYTFNAEATAIDKVTNKENNGEINNEIYYDLNGKKVNKETRGVLIKKSIFKNGTVETSKYIAK